ncbi:MAG: hypothetical protein AAFQ14_09795 [Cyanobacteria bacterium J06621_12]
MEIKTIKYMRRNNLGNYNHEEVELFAELNDEDDPEEAIAALKEKAEISLGIIVPEPKNPF